MSPPPPAALQPPTPSAAGSVGTLSAFGAGQVAVAGVVAMLIGLGAVLVTRRRRRTAPGP